MSVAGYTFTRPAAGPPPTLSIVDVPRMAYRGELAGRRIRVVLRFPLRFSADRRMGTYSPSAGGAASPTAVFHFRETIQYSPGIVEGTVREFRIDTGERLNRLPGYAVISDCVPD